MAHARFDLIDADDNVLVANTDWLGTPSPPLEPGADFVERSMLYGCRVCSSTALIRRSAVPEGGFLQRDHPPFDFAFWLRMAERWAIAFIDEPLCAYRIHSNSFTSGNSTVTDHGYQQAERMLRDVHGAKRRHAATLPRGARRSKLERLADRALRRDLVYRVRERTLPDRDFKPTFQGLAELARREPALLREPAAWALLAGSIVGPERVERLKGRA